MTSEFDSFDFVCKEMTPTSSLVEPSKKIKKKAGKSGSILFWESMK
jgi:hypothetical protein